MKKGLFILTMVFSVFALSACGGEPSDQIAVSSVGDNPDEKQADYVVNIDDSFNTGVKIDDTKKTLSPEEADFRNLKWGMTKDEVAYAQGSGYRELSENKMYYTRVREEGFPADAEYTFNEGKLVQGMFFITHGKTDKPVEIADYMELVNALKNRFGEPKIADFVYGNAEDKTDDEGQQLWLIKNGKLQLRTGWILENTELRIVMFPRNGEACIGLQYKQAGAEVPAE